jgi:predicted transcriptional regulator
MNSILVELNRARDVAANYALIEEEEIVVEMDGRQHFEAAVGAALKQDEAATRAALASILPFTTTSWKAPHPEARDGKINWPWTIDQ